MTRALIAGFVASEAVKPKQIIVSGRTPGRLEGLQKKFGVAITTDNEECVAASHIVFLAVKPQDFTRAAPAIKRRLKPSHILISVMAGILIRDIQRATEAASVVKAMPTLAVSHCKGSTVWSHSPQLAGADREKVHSLLALLGKELRLDDDRMVDLSATISGCSLAYFYLFVDLLIRNGERLGFPLEISTVIAKQALVGAASLMEENHRSLEDRIAEIAPKGGMTEAALSVLTKGLDPVLAEAIDAAAARATALSISQPSN